VGKYPTGTTTNNTRAKKDDSPKETERKVFGKEKQKGHNKKKNETPLKPASPYQGKGGQRHKRGEGLEPRAKSPKTGGPE